MTFEWAPMAARIGLAAGVLAVILAVVSRARRLWLAALLTLLIPAGVIAGLLSMKAKAGSVPPIHDYATDWREPIMPSARLLALRGPDANPVEPDPRMEPRAGRPEVENWADDRIARVGSEACAGAKPVRLALGPAEAEARVEAVLAAEGLALHSGDELGRVEATDTSFWYGFKDDVIARIRPDGTGSRVDLRSISRVGGSDLGDNCERITAIVAALSAPAQGSR
jgi:fatty-acyl-CoA synthase